MDCGEVYLCDMGIAKVKKLSEATVTSDTKGPGTYPYMAPEMFIKSRRGPAVDIYSLGCLYIELFGRERIWKGLDGAGIMQKVLGSFNIPPQAPSVDHLMPVYADLCTRMCSLDSTRRPKSSEVFTLLKQIANKEDPDFP